MEVVEPLLLTLTSVRELVSNNEEVGNEVEELGKMPPKDIAQNYYVTPCTRGLMITIILFQGKQ